MKLRNKKTGEIVDVESLGHADSLKGKFGYQVTLSWKIDEHLDTCKTYNSLAELNEEWEDAPEEPKEYWYIDYNGTVKCFQYLDYDWQEEMQSIGNYFSSKEEAEKALEKLKAFKRLKDNGMIKYSFHKEKTGIDLDFYTLTILAPRDKDSLDLLFGGEE